MPLPLGIDGIRHRLCWGTGDELRMSRADDQAIGSLFGVYVAVLRR